MENNEIRILGGKQHSSVKILSAHSPLPPEAATPSEPVVVRVHEEIITEDEDARKKRKPGDPEIRVRYSSADFEKIRRGEDE